MKTIIFTVISAVFPLLQGCASLTKSHSQEVVIEARHDSAPTQTVCTAKNDKGSWDTSPGVPVKVHRSRYPLQVECANSVQYGGIESVPRRSKGTRLMNMMFIDFCTVSCAIDRKTGAGYSYNNVIPVYMGKN